MRQQNKSEDVKQEGLTHTLTLCCSSWNIGASMIDALAWGLWKEDNEKGSFLHLAPFQLRSWKANTKLDLQVSWPWYNIINKTLAIHVRFLYWVSNCYVCECFKTTTLCSTLQMAFHMQKNDDFVLWCLRLNQTEMTLHHPQNSQSKPKTTPQRKIKPSIKGSLLQWIKITLLGA